MNESIMVTLVRALEVTQKMLGDDSPEPDAAAAINSRDTGLSSSLISVVDEALREVKREVKKDQDRIIKDAREFWKRANAMIALDGISPELVDSLVAMDHEISRLESGQK